MKERVVELEKKVEVAEVEGKRKDDRIVELSKQLDEVKAKVEWKS